MQKYAKISKIGKISFGILVFTLLLIAVRVSVSGATLMVLPGGQNIGLRMETGVYIVGRYEVETINGKVSPWKTTDVKNGDRILEVDQVPIKSNLDIQKVLQGPSALDGSLILTISRNQATFDTGIDVVETKNGEKSLGLYIKDRLVGIGTVTFIDPAEKKFASLGHGIYDPTLTIGSVKGTVLNSNIEAIKKALPGTPGEKLASLGTLVYGIATKNSATGVYGLITNPSMLQGKTMAIGTQEEVKVGKASILTTLDDNQVKRYDIEILEVNRQTQPSSKGLRVKMTDPTLIQKTGGIIQGMSGSPIIQNNKIIGAISHVTVDEPLFGYGMMVEWMLADLKTA